MHIVRKTVILVFLIILTVTSVSSYSEAYAQSDKSTVNLGVLAFRPAPETIERWQPLADYLDNEIPEYSFELVALNYDALTSAVESGDVDFVLTNPAHYIEIRRHNELSGAISTLVELDDDVPLSEFGGVIFALDEPSAPEKLEDLDGITISAVNRSSLGGYQAPAYELSNAGINLQEENILTTDMPHDNAVTAVLEGKAEAGFARAGVIESMLDEGKITEDELRIINSQEHEDFPYVASTPLYPEWPVVSLPHVDDAISRRVASALFDMEIGCSTAQEIGIYGFTVPSYYQPVEDMMRDLRIPPFDEAPEFDLGDVWDQYQWSIVTILALTAIILVMLLLLSSANRSLKISQNKIETLYKQLDEQVNTLVGIHESTFIKDAPEIEDVSIASFFQPTDRLGGDLYGYIKVNDKLILYLSDVSGHGIESVSFNAFLKGTVESYISLRPDDINPRDILEHIYQQYDKENYPDDYFICIFLSVLDLETREMSYSGVGFQNPPLLKQNGDLIHLASKGLPISSNIPAELMEFTTAEISLEPGDTILFYTDGIAEETSDGEIYEDRLKEVFVNNANRDPDTMTEIIKEDFTEFNNGHLKGEDDITFVILQLKGETP